MLFTYTFGEKLDLEKFRRQAAHYIGKMREVSYNLYLPHYKVVLEISGLDNSKEQIITVMLLDLKRDSNGWVHSGEAIYPLEDVRFKNNPDIQAVFTATNNFRGSFSVADPLDGVEKICRVVKLLHKLDHLKAFL